MKNLFNTKKMAIFILIVGLLLTMIGMYLTYNNLDAKLYNLLVSIIIVIFSIYGLFGKYNQDINSGRNTEKINHTTKDIQYSLKEEKVKRNLSKLRKYQELELKFQLELNGMKKMYFVTYDKESLILLRRNFIQIIDQILQNSFVAENELVFTEWLTIRNRLLVFFNFYSLPNGLVTAEDDKEIVVSNELKINKLKDLDRFISKSEFKMNLFEQEYLNQNEN